MRLIAEMPNDLRVAVNHDGKIIEIENISISAENAILIQTVANRSYGILEIAEDIEEEWRPIKDCEPYEVSNLGRIRSPFRRREGGVLAYFVNHDGYFQVTLTVGGLKKTFRVHRLVADAFLENPEHKKLVNHINENKLDNRVSNLEWCDYKHNLNCGTINERMSKSHKIKIGQYNQDGELIAIHNSVAEAAQSVGVSGPCISQVCRGKRERIKGYVWRYLSRPLNSVSL